MTAPIDAGFAGRAARMPKAHPGGVPKDGKSAGNEFRRFCACFDSVKSRSYCTVSASVVLWVMAVTPLLDCALIVMV